MSEALRRGLAGREAGEGSEQASVDQDSKKEAKEKEEQVKEQKEEAVAQDQENKQDAGEADKSE